MLLAARCDVPPYQLPRLPYAMDALEPYMSRETLAFHYEKHHRGYMNKLNSLIQNTGSEDVALEDLVRNSSGALFNNAAQVWNHNFFWQCLTPERNGAASGALARLIVSAFGSVNTFMRAFKDRALDKFGSGWTWLVRTHDRRLMLMNTDDAENPLKLGAVPLLTCDVWEHAYYIDYRNDRAGYVNAFWNVVNWRFVENNLAK